MKISIGAPAPDFTLQDQNGKTHLLNDYRGQYVLLYFYPKDDTSGCTVEACGMRDNLPKFEDLKAVVLGVSIDSVESHMKFAKKFSLSFPLLADTEKKAVEDYGVWQEKSMYGKKYMGIVRSSFLIGPDGTVVKIYENVKPELHTAEVLADLEQLQK